MKNLGFSLACYLALLLSSPTFAQQHCDPAAPDGTLPPQIVFCGQIERGDVLIALNPYATFPVPKNSNGLIEIDLTPDSSRLIYLFNPSVSHPESTPWLNVFTVPLTESLVFTAVSTDQVNPKYYSRSLDAWVCHNGDGQLAPYCQVWATSSNNKSAYLTVGLFGCEIFETAPTASVKLPQLLQCFRQQALPKPGYPGLVATGKAELAPLFRTRV